MLTRIEEHIWSQSIKLMFKRFSHKKSVLDRFLKKLRNLIKKGKFSTEWLIRRLSDIYLILMMNVALKKQNKNFRIFIKGKKEIEAQV